MNNKPKIYMYGEVNGNKRGIQIKGDGGALYNGSFDVELDGVQMEQVRIENSKGSTANITDLKTDSPIVNTGGSLLNLKRAEVFLKKRLNKWWENTWIQVLVLLSSIISLFMGFFEIYKMIFNH
jgi:hypothetical protein